MAHAMTTVGAHFQNSPDTHDGSGWHSMDRAPRDGTVIELRCTYGVAPWYGLHAWDEDGYPGGWWRDCKDDRTGVGSDSEDTLSWRPFNGDPAAYVDPTNGAQMEGAYWRGAVAAKHGLSPGYFEQKPSHFDPKPSKPWWRRLLPL